MSHTKISGLEHCRNDRRGASDASRGDLAARGSMMNMSGFVFDEDRTLTKGGLGILALHPNLSEIVIAE